jgi:hypothetical protein
LRVAHWRAVAQAALAELATAVAALRPPLQAGHVVDDLGASMTAARAAALGARAAPALTHCPCASRG